MDPDLKLHINATGKYRTEYLTSAIQNLSKLDSYKDFIFNNINRNISTRVQKLQDLKSRINRIKAILPKLNECNHAMTIKSRKYYPTSQHKYYKYLNLEDRPEEINNLINSIYNCNNPNIPKTNIKRPLVEKGENGNLGKILKETFDDCISYQLLSNMQKKIRDLASELFDLRFKSMGSSLVNELNDLVYEKTPYFETNFGFINKKLIQKADSLWKINKEDIDLKQNVSINQMKNDEDEEPQFAKKSSKKLPKNLQEAPKSIVSKVKIEKTVTKKVLIEKTEKQEFNLPTSINLRGIAELQDEVVNEETPNVDENIYPEREDLDIDFENQTDINNLNFDDDFDLPVDIITRKNLENLKNEGNNVPTSTPNYNYQSANTSNINNNNQNTINYNVNNNINNNTNNNINNNVNSVPQVTTTTTSSGPIVVIGGSGPGIPPPPPPPPPPPVVPVKKTVAKKPEKEVVGEEGQNEENDEPKKELSMAEQLATIKLKKVGTVKAKEVPKKPKVVNHNDLLKQQILLRFKNLRLHEEENDEEEENEDD